MSSGAVIKPKIIGIAVKPSRFESADNKTAVSRTTDIALNESKYKSSWLFFAFLMARL